MNSRYSRRQILAGSGAFALLHATAAQAQAAYPSKPIRLLVSALPGQTADLVMRVVAEKLASVLGQSIVVENRAGAGSVVGLAVGARAAPDGYTLIMAPSSMTISPHLRRDLPYDVAKDFAPIGNVVFAPLGLATRADSPFASLRDLIAAAKARPGQVTYGSTINGTPHLAVEILQQRAGVRFQHVPYKGSTQAHTDLLGGQIDFLSDSLPAIIGHIKGGKMRALAVASAQRQAFLPDVPTVAESGVPDFQVEGWIGLLAPTGTPADILDKVNADLAKVLADESLRARLYQLSASPAPMSRPAFTEFIANETRRFGDIIRAAGIKGE